MHKYTFTIKKNIKSNKDIINSIENNGFAKISNLYSNKLIDNLILQVNKALKNPSVCGSFGYAKKDHYRKYIYPPLVMGNPLKEVILNRFLIKIVESYFRCEPVLAELHIKHDEPAPYVYFPPHLDIFPGWQKSNDLKQVNKNDMKKRLGLGCIIYLKDCDTASGNFMYALGSHKSIFLKGGAIKNYSKKEKDNIYSQMVNLDGKKGDIIIFDDRGWHGPNQPAKKNRTVVELDFTNPSYLGRWQAIDLQLPISMLTDLEEKELRILGKNSKILYDKYNYKISTFNRNPFFKIQEWLIKYAYITEHYKKIIKLLYSKMFKKTN